MNEIIKSWKHSDSKRNCKYYGMRVIIIKDCKNQQKSKEKNCYDSIILG